MAIDALHMLAFIDIEPADQLKWGRQALAVVQASSQASAKAWEAPLRSNVGNALHQLGRHEEALAQFEQAVVLRERGPDQEATRIAHWMVGRSLRVLNRTEEGLEIQLRLERERQDAGKPSPYVFEELELLYRTSRRSAATRRCRPSVRPRAILLVRYQGRKAYYVTPACCDIPSELIDEAGELLCYPDGGFAGGDGKCPAFALGGNAVVTAWRDSRSPAGREYRARP